MINHMYVDAGIMSSISCKHMKALSGNGHM